MSDTPLTDAQESFQRRGYDNMREIDWPSFPADFDFARDLESKLTAAQSDLDSDSIVASCNCVTKSPAVEHHKPGCKYRLIVERDAAQVRIKELEADKARLDWIESQLDSSFLELCHYKFCSQLSGEAASFYDCAKPYYVGGELGPCGSTLREAIDDAMKREEP